LFRHEKRKKGGGKKTAKNKGNRMGAVAGHRKKEKVKKIKTTRSTEALLWKYTLAIQGGTHRWRRPYGDRNMR